MLPQMKASTTAINQLEATNKNSCHTLSNKSFYNTWKRAKTFSSYLLSYSLKRKLLQLQEALALLTVHRVVILSQTKASTTLVISSMQAPSVPGCHTLSNESFYNERYKSGSKSLTDLLSYSLKRKLLQLPLWQKRPTDYVVILSQTKASTTWMITTSTAISMLLSYSLKRKLLQLSNRAEVLNIKCCHTLSNESFYNTLKINFIINSFKHLPFYSFDIEEYLLISEFFANALK
mgnify:CR=1 FL=1